MNDLRWSTCSSEQIMNRSVNNVVQTDATHPVWLLSGITASSSCVVFDTFIPVKRLHLNGPPLFPPPFPDTSRALIADLEDTSGGTPTAATAMIVEEDDRNGGGTINPSSMNFVQYIEEADVGVGELVVDANGGAAGESTSGANGTRNITFEMVEIDSEGNKHTRTMSYEEALAEGHITTEEADVKGGSSGSSSGAAGLVKGKTKMAS